MSDTPNRSWFAELRRDGGLFVLLGVLVLLLNIVQPLAAAAAGDGGHLVICTVDGNGKPLRADLPGAMPNGCPICIAGNHCTSSAPGCKAALAPQPAFAGPASFTLPGASLEVRALPASRLADSPSAARAPPPSA